MTFFKGRFIVLILICIFLAACASPYVYRSAKSPEYRLNSSSNIGLVIEGSPLAASFIQSAFIANGLNVKNILPTDMIPVETRLELELNNKYNFIGSMIKGGGEIEVDENTAKTISQWDETQEAAKRFEGMAKLVNMIRENWKIDVMVFIKISPDNKQVFMRMWDLQRHSLVLNFFASAPQGDWIKVFDDSYLGDFKGMSDNGTNLPEKLYRNLSALATELASRVAE